MPRIARKQLETTYFHVMTQGIEKRYIFNEDKYKLKYIELLNKHSTEYEINIIAYCIMDNHVHLLLETNKIEDMSKFMHKINFKYAQYYNYMENGRIGYVFRNRFTSEPICDEKYLYNCIRYIYNNPVKAGIVKYPYQYKYSNYNEKKYNLNNDLYELEEYIFADVDISKKETIDIIVKKSGLSKKELNKRENKNKLKEIVLKLKNDYKVTYKEIAKETGISLSKISRVAKKWKDDLFLPRPQISQKGENYEI